MFTRLLTQLRQAPLATILAGCLMLAFLLVTDLVPFLRGGFGWQWPYQPASMSTILLLILVLTVYVAIGWLLRRCSARWLLCWSMIGVVAISVGVLRLRADDAFAELVARTMSPLTTGIHALAADLPPDDPGWREWTTVMQRYEGQIAHVTLAPPALPLVYAALFRLLDGAPGIAAALQSPLIPYQCSQYQFLSYSPSEWAGVWLGVLMPFWAALGAIPLYIAARRYLSPSAAKVALLIFPLVPALTLFTPTWNTVYPLMSLAAFIALAHGIDARRTRWLILAGFLSGLWIFVNFAFVPLLLFFGVYTLSRWWFAETRASFLRPVSTGLWFGVGLAAPWIVYGVLTGQTPWALLSTSMGQHLSLEREYLPWVWLHFWDWALWTGLPLILLWLAAVWRWKAKRQPPLLAFSLLITVTILVFSNFARGETGRVWLLFAPFALLAAVDGLERLKAGSRGTLAALIVQCIWLTAVGSVIIAAETALPGRPDAPAPQTVDNPLGVRFDPGFELLGWSAVQVGDDIDLTLNWQATRQLVEPYWFSGLIVSPDGQPVGSAFVWMPDETRYPTTCWQAGEIVTDHVTIPLPDAIEPGDYWLSLTAFSDAYGQDRVNIVSGDLADTQVGFGAITIR